MLAPENSDSDDGDLLLPRDDTAAPAIVDTRPDQVRRILQDTEVLVATPATAGATRSCSTPAFAAIVVCFGIVMCATFTVLWATAVETRPGAGGSSGRWPLPERAQLTLVWSDGVADVHYDVPVGLFRVDWGQGAALWDMANCTVSQYGPERGDCVTRPLNVTVCERYWLAALSGPATVRRYLDGDLEYVELDSANSVWMQAFGDVAGAPVRFGRTGEHETMRVDRFSPVRSAPVTLPAVCVSEAQWRPPVRVDMGWLQRDMAPRCPSTWSAALSFARSERGARCLFSASNVTECADWRQKWPVEWVYNGTVPLRGCQAHQDMLQNWDVPFAASSQWRAWFSCAPCIAPFPKRVVEPDLVYGYFAPKLSK